MKAEYKRDLQNNYLILEVAEADAEDGYGLRMAEQNQVRGLLPMHESRQDGKLYLHYEITSKQTLESMYEKKVMGYQDILYVLAGIRDTLEDMRRYLLSPRKLLFAPDMMYVLPERGGLMLCYYANENEYPITVLAEFILKKLDHKDRQAVTLGYGFFQQASSANFSLPKALADILSVSGEAGRKAEAHLAGKSGVMRADISMPESGSTMRAAAPMAGGGSIMRAAAPMAGGGSAARAATAMAGGSYAMSADMPMAENGGKADIGSMRVEDRRFVGREDEDRMDSKADAAWMGADGSRSGRTAKEEFAKRGAAMSSERWDAWQDDDGYGQENWAYEEEDPPVIHRERKRRQKPEKTLADRVFSKVHPAILLTFLLLMIVLELLIAFEVFGLTEAGGCFFLVLSAEILLNRRLLQKKESTAAQWQEEEEDEEYQRVLREMYQNESGSEPEPIEETRCLSFEEEPKKLILVHEPHKGDPEPYPDICPGAEALYIGKIEGEADVLLRSATVSRMHARVTACDESKCYLKDMNSKNGCFVNGRRLSPHEECELQEGDTVAFAEIEYHVVKR